MKPPTKRPPKGKPQSALMDTLDRKMKHPPWGKGEMAKGRRLDPTTDNVRKPTRGAAEVDPNTSMNMRSVKPKFRRT